MKKYLPVISNACFLLSLSLIVHSVKPTWWLTYILVSIGFELLFVVIVIFIVPVYKRTFPKVLGNVNVKPKSAIRNAVINTVCLLLPKVLDLIG